VLRKVRQIVKAYWLLLTLPFILWAGAQGYQVWITETVGPHTVAPAPGMQTGYGFCLDMTSAMGCPGVYGGYVRGPNLSCESIGFWTCTGLFRADYAWGYWRVVSH